jgi:tetratricopeptide (TPR) repeat protein
MNRMRIIVAFLSFTLAFAVWPASADQSDPRLDRLFQQLARATTPPEAQGVEKEIQTLWLRSGSDTVDVLMARALASVEGQDAATAKKLYDAVTEMKPDYAEVWYQRGALLVAMDSAQEAVPDLQRAAELEPRHYQAFALVGRIAEGAGDKRAALASYRRAVAINPQLEAIKRKIAALAAELEGKDI